MNHRSIGILGVIFGLVGLSIFFIRDVNELILSNSNIFFVKYFTVILAINGSFFFILLGVLLFLGKLIPSNKYEKARNNLLALAFTSPCIVSLVTTVLTQSDSMLWTIVGWTMLLCFLFEVFHSFKIISTNRND